MLMRDPSSMTERLKVQPISGFPEWLPGHRLAEQRLLTTIREQYELFGFAPIETPAVERMDVLLSKGGIQRQIYTIGRPEEGASSSKDEPGLGLHFDLTVPLARYVALHAANLTFPFRRYQIQKVWRGERAQRGRFREFYQCDVDIIGRNSLEPIHDAEMPVVINSTFEACGFPDFKVLVSNRHVLDDLLKTRASGADQLPGALRAIDKSMRDGMEKTKESLAKEGIDAELIPAVMDLIQCPSIDEARAILKRAGAGMRGIDELQMLVSMAADLGMPPARLQPCFAIARGLDYYTGAVFETFVVGKENWGSICSGGRYDDLAAFFSNQKYPGVGVSIGLTRLFDLLVKENLIDVSRSTPTQVLVTTQDRDAYMKEYLEIARVLRESGIAAEIFFEPAPLRDQFGYASGKGIPWAIVAGEREVSQGTVAVKDLVNRTQETVERHRLIEYIRTKVTRERA